MNAIEQIHQRATQHLAEARQAAEAMSQCTADWTARIMLKQEFRSVEEALHEFALNQFGIQDNHQPHTTNQPAHKPSYYV